MSNLWEFLFQSLTISMIAAILLIIKYIFRDKLSALWHYGIWGVLALRIIVPVSGGGKYILMPLELWLETLKGAVEGGLTSSYSKVFEPMNIQFSFPIVSSRPISITDWLFIIYLIGVIVVLARYFLNYLRLRRLLNNGGYLSIENQELIDSIAIQYKLKSCKAVEIEGILSPFVCGIIKPILVIPSNKKIDEKIILHELLHLKYKDALQSTLWSILRSFHWCNPFIHYIFNQIENDMEILCDYRVLEKLQGEERRAYGEVLLSMVNEKYPCAPGTTSISNGGKNISRRIISITRFKKHPKGMSLLSICISVILLQYFFLGAEASGIVFKEGYLQSHWELHQAMASARINRCTTIAGALDTYAKGILYNNGLYIAAASPLGAHEELAEKMKDNLKNKNIEYYYIDGDLTGEVNWDMGGYAIYNLIETDDKSYRADIVFAIRNFFAPASGERMYTEEGMPIGGFITYPVTITYEDSWVITREGEKKIYPFTLSVNTEIFMGNDNIPKLAAASGEGETGRVTAFIQSVYQIHSAVLYNNTDEAFTDPEIFNERPQLDAEFSTGYLLTEFVFNYKDSEKELEDINSVGMLIGEGVSEAGLDKWEIGGRVYGWGEEFVDENLDKSLDSEYLRVIDFANNKIGAIPSDYTVKIYFDAELRETITMKGGEFIE